MAVFLRFLKTITIYTTPYTNFMRSFSIFLLYFFSLYLNELNDFQNVLFFIHHFRSNIVCLVYDFMTVYSKNCYNNCSGVEKGASSRCEKYWVLALIPHVLKVLSKIIFYRTGNKIEVLVFKSHPKHIIGLDILDMPMFQEMSKKHPKTTTGQETIFITIGT